MTLLTPQQGAGNIQQMKLSDLLNFTPKQMEARRALFEIEQHMDTLVTGLAQCQSVIDCEPALWIGIEGSDMVCVRRWSLLSADATGVAVAFQYGGAPVLESGSVAQVLYFARFAAATIGRRWQDRLQVRIVDGFRATRARAEAAFHAFLSDKRFTAPFARHLFATGVGIMHKSVVPAQDRPNTTAFVVFRQCFTAPAGAVYQFIRGLALQFERAMVEVALMVSKPASRATSCIDGERFAAPAGACGDLFCTHRPIVPQNMAEWSVINV